MKTGSAKASDALPVWPGAELPAGEEPSRGDALPRARERAGFVSSFMDNSLFTVALMRQPAGSISCVAIWQRPARVGGDTSAGWLFYCNSNLAGCLLRLWRGRQCQLSHGRPFEKAAQRQLGLECGAYARDHLRCQQRLAAEFEKVVMHTDRLDPQQLLPDAGDGLLGFVARCDAIDAQLRPRVKRGGLSARSDDGGRGLEVDPLVDPRLEIGRRNRDA